MAKKLSAAMKKQISETLKKRWAEKKAKAAAAANEIRRVGLRVTPSPIAQELARMGLRAEPASFGRTVVSPMPSTPRSSRDEALQLAADIVDIVSDEASPLSLVRVVDRILRP